MSARRRRPPRQNVTVYCSIRFSGLSIVKLACEELGLTFSSLPVDIPKSRVVIGLHEHELSETWVSCKRGASIGRLFGADDCTDKGCFEDLICLARELTPGLFSQGFPETWVLPQAEPELRAVMAAAPRGAFISKPRNSSEGNGIHLLLGAEGGLRGQEAVVQRYVSSPLLLEGIKFDLRLYVFVKKLQPLELWMCREGLARFCTEPYQNPAKSNLYKVASFLTNYSLNKRSENFVHSDDPHGGHGSKRSLSSTIPLILQALPSMSEEELWSRLSTVTTIGMLPLIPYLISAERQQRHRHKEVVNGPSFCQLFGVDVLLDADGMPWLLEVNSFPSMSMNSTLPFTGDGKPCRCMDDYKPHSHVDSPVDRTVKLSVMRGLLQLLQDDLAGHGSDFSREVNGEGPFVAGYVANSFFALPAHGDADRLVRMLTSLAEVFGSCCKGGSAAADPFRLRKWFTSIGSDAAQVDLQLRQLAQQPEGLTLLPVSNLLLKHLRIAQPDLPLLDALGSTLENASRLF